MAAVPQSVLIIEARFYDDIVNELVRGAVAELERKGTAYERVGVPGALEIGPALSLAIANNIVGEEGRHGGCVALGCVIRGKTSHYDIVAQGSAQALMDLSLAHSIAVGNGVLTVDNRDQAWVRARVDEKNKGRDAAAACLSLMALQSGPFSDKKR